MKGLFLPAAALILSLRAPAAYGTTYYVATTGNDANDGLSAQSAFLTLAQAVATPRPAEPRRSTSRSNIPAGSARASTSAASRRTRPARSSLSNRNIP